MKKNKKTNLGDLCEGLFKANIEIYKYENDKWWGRRSKSATAEQIDDWDRKSREWNEKRSSIKRDIDSLISSKFRSSNRKVQEARTQDIFIAFPVSLMIDMLTIEHIKLLDLKEKKDAVGAKKARGKIAGLKRIIDDSIEKIKKDGRYSSGHEARTF